MLTSGDMAGFSDADLTTEALLEIEATGLIREDGDRIVIGDYRV